MATRVNYHGNTELAMRYKLKGDQLLESLRKSLPDVLPSSLTRFLSDGTKVTVNRVTKDLETIDIWAVTSGTKDRWEWTLLYAPCPYPDPQNWPGWWEADKDTLVSFGYNNEFFLIPWGNALWDVMVYTPVSDTSASFVDLEDGGFSVLMDSTYGATATYYGWKLSGLRRTVVYDVSFGGLFEWQETYTYDTDAVIQFTFQWASLYNPPVLTVNGFDRGIWLNPGQYSGWGGIQESKTITHTEATIDWQSSWNLGVWKIELTSYNPSSYIDEDNYILWYDRSIFDTSDANGQSWAIGQWATDSWWDSPIYGGYYGGKASQAYIDFGDLWGEHHCATAIYDEAVNWVTNVEFPPYVTVGFYTYRMRSPWDYGSSDGGDFSNYNATYTTEVRGKINGIEFHEVLGTATKTGSINNEWSGDNVFPWMGRIYRKDLLLTGEEGQEEPSLMNLLIASYLKGAASNTYEYIPGCINGITSVHYFKMHETSPSIDYSASHPGWHDVYTDDRGRTWRAYGDLFAALKKVKGVI